MSYYSHRQSSKTKTKVFTPSAPRDINEIDKSRQEGVAMKAKIRSVGGR